MPTDADPTHPASNGVRLVVFAVWDYRGRQGRVESLEGVEGEVFERLASALPTELGVDARRLRAAWRFAVRLQPDFDLANLVFPLAEGGLIVGVLRKRVEL
jgi:hypothetical protein